MNDWKKICNLKVNANRVRDDFSFFMPAQDSEGFVQIGTGKRHDACAQGQQHV
jgi:hypothetical protein